MSTEYSATSQSAVWKSRVGNPYGTIPDTADNAGVDLYTAKGTHTAPELPITAKHMLLDRWIKGHYGDEDD